MSYSQSELEDAADHIIKAEEIRKNKELMKELEPYIKDHISHAESALSLKDLWKKGLKEAQENESKDSDNTSEDKAEVEKSELGPDKEDHAEEQNEMKKHKGEKVASKFEPKIMSKG